MKFRYILATIFSIIIMSFCAISASAESWIDFGHNEFYYNSIGEKMPEQITRNNATRTYYGTPNGEIPKGNFPSADIKGVVVMRSYTSGANYDYYLFTYIYITNIDAGATLALDNNRYDDIKGGWFNNNIVKYSHYSISYDNDNYDDGYYHMSAWSTWSTYPYDGNWYITFNDIIYSDYSLSRNGTIYYTSNSTGAYYDTLETVVTVNSSGVGGYIKRYGTPDFDNTQIYFRTAVVDSLVNPPLGYQFGKSLSQQNVNATNLYEPNYNDVYTDYISPLRTFPLLSNEFSSLYNVTPINLSVLPAYMQGILRYDKSYTCLIMVSTAWLAPFDDWIIIGSQSFNYSAGTIIDLGQNISPPADDNNGGVDLGATPPEHNWGVNGSDVVVPEIDFTSPEYKNPFDVSFLFFYPENGENKPTFYLQYCLIAIAICAVAYLLFGKS